MFLLAVLLLALVDPRVLTPDVRQFERAEIELPSPVAPSNPFDPNMAAVDATVTLPSGRTIRVPAFYFQDYTRSVRNPEAEGNARIETLTPKGAPGWRVRFASPEAGKHRISVDWRIDGQTGRSSTAEIDIKPGPRTGYIRQSARNASYLEHSTGEPFFAIGENLCMYEKREGTYYYERILPKLAANGANYVRLWQEYYVPRDLSIVAGAGDGDFTGFPLETQATGLGRYDLESAWRLDNVAAQCERLDIYYQIAFEMTVWWQPRQKHRWPRNPYNAANGGPCKTPEDYFTDPAARELVRRRLRYSVARWGWSPHLAAWELWNEVDNNYNFNSEANTAWHREMAAYLKEIDPWAHLITTSWRDPGMFSLPDIDIVQGHSYWDAEYDAAEYALQDTDHLMSPYGKPYFFGEQGIGNSVGAMKFDPEGRHFHDSIWATALSGAAGTGLYWWWHNYVEGLDLYHHYKPLAAFLKGEDLAARKWTRAELTRPNLPVSLKLYGLVASDRALLWIHDTLGFRVIDGKPVQGPPQNGASLNVKGLADGEYTIEWWDTQRGELIQREKGNVKHTRHFGYGLELKPPAFQYDIAARITRENGGGQR